MKVESNRGDIDALIQKMEEVIEDEEDISARENPKGKWAQLAKLVGCANRNSSSASVNGPQSSKSRSSGSEFAP